MIGNFRWHGTRTALLFAVGLLVVLSGTAYGQGLTDDFDSYALGTLSTQSPNWTGWDGSDAASGNVVDSTAPYPAAASAPNSVELPLNSDCVALLDGVEGGAWSISVKYYIPTSSVVGRSWLGVFDQYSNGGTKTSGYGIYFDMAAGTATDDEVTFPIVRDAWVELKFDMIDLTTNTMVVSYNGTVVNPHTEATGGKLQIQGLDFWSDGGDVVYIDDLVTTQLPDPTACDASGMKMVALGVHNSYQNLPDPSWRPSTTADDGCEPGVVMSGTGGDIWGNADNAHFLYNCDDTLHGNFDASVLIQSFENIVDGANDGEWGRAGFMVRASTDSNSPNEFLGVNMRGMPADPNQRKLLHSSRDSVGGGTSDNRQDNFHTPIWVRLRRVGDSFTSYYKYAEADPWTEFATRTTVMPRDVAYGYGLCNHGNNNTKPPFVAAFCHLETVQLADVWVTNVVGLPQGAGVELTWVPGGTIDHYEISRTDASGTVVLETSLVGTATSYQDNTPIDGNTATYVITPFDAASETPGGVPITYSVDLTTDDGSVTTWLLSPHYNQGGGANPPNETMALDYLTDGAGNDETNFIPEPGRTILTDYGNAAASTGCNAANSGTTCDPPTFFLYQSSDGYVDFNNIFGDINNVMTYLITYVTNNTGSTLHARCFLKPDDSAEVKLDNTVWYYFNGCCSFREFYMPIPDGEHRIMVKVFEGTGGHNNHLRIVDWDTGQPFAAGELVVSPIPTMTSVPAALPDLVGLDGSGNLQDWLISAHLYQPYGAQPSDADKALDYLTEGPGGEDETTIIPQDGTTVATDYTLAASTGCTCGTVLPTGCGCDPFTFFQYTATSGLVDFSAIFGDTDQVMNYLVTYVTNTTGGDLIVRGQVKIDDSGQIILGNSTWYFAGAPCCQFYDFFMVIPDGEHRLMIKAFEGGGGANCHLRLLDEDGIPLPRGALEVRSAPTITTLPPVPSVAGTRVVPTIPSTTPDPVTVTINLVPSGAPVDVYERVRAPWPAPTNISAPGNFDPVSETIFWSNVTDSVSYQVEPFPGQPGLVGVVDDGAVLGPIEGPGLIPYVDVEDQEGWNSATIADSGLAMSSTVIKTSDSPELYDMTIVASGHDIWDAADDFRYVWKEIPADGAYTIQARLDSFPRTTSDWGKLGLMVRANVSQGSPHVQAAFRTGVADPPDSTGYQMQWRDNPDTGSGNQDPLTEVPLPYWMRGVYDNGQYSGYFAPDVGGQPGAWVLAAGSPRTVNTLGQDTVLIGISCTSHDDNAIVTAEVSNVSLTSCVPKLTVTGWTEGMVGETLQLVAEGLDELTATYLWTIESGAGEIIGWDDESVVDVLGTAPGDVMVRIVASEPGCDPETVVTKLTFAPLPDCVVTVSDPPLDAKVGETVQLTASGLGGAGTTYAWTIDSGSSTGAGTIVGAADAATVEVQGTAEGDVVVQLVAGQDDCTGVTIRTTIPFEQIPVNWRPCDTTGEGTLDLTDVINFLNYTFVGSYTPDCVGALDCDGSGALDLTDAVQSLNYQFVNGVPPTHPAFFNCALFTQSADGTGDPCPVSEGCP